MPRSRSSCALSRPRSTDSTRSGTDVRTTPEIRAADGAGMDPFPPHRHIASWIQRCTGTHESAGKRSLTGSGKGKRY